MADEISKTGRKSDKLSIVKIIVTVCKPYYRSIPLLIQNCFKKLSEAVSDMQTLM